MRTIEVPETGTTIYRVIRRRSRKLRAYTWHVRRVTMTDDLIAVYVRDAGKDVFLSEVAAEFEAARRRMDAC